MYTCITSFLRKLKLTLPSTPDAVFTSPNGRDQKFQGEGGPRGGNFQGVGLDSQGLFSRTLKQELLLMILH